MARHQRERNSNMPANFRARVESSYKDCLSRQVAEGVHIKEV